MKLYSQAKKIEKVNKQSRNIDFLPETDTKINFFWSGKDLKRQVKVEVIISNPVVFLSSA